jgi:hypothetical protein
MLIRRILGIGCVGTYLLAMCLPAIAAKSYYKTYLLHGWEVTYMCALLSFAPSMNLVEKAQFIVGTFSNVLFLFGIALFLGREFCHWSRPRYAVICWISAVCLVCSVVSVSIAGTSQNSFLIGFYLWIVSPILLLIGTWIECLRQRKTFLNCLRVSES